MHEKIEISVFSLWRDSEKYIERTLSKLDDIEKRHPEISFSYFFYENDSVDNTALILKDWINNKNGTFVSEKLNSQREEFVITPSRMQKMAYFRNRMINIGRFIKSKYSIIFDSDVIFEADIVNKFLSKIDDETVMYTPNIKQNIACKWCNCGQQSYYDVAALKDLFNHNGLCWCHNPFINIFDRQKFELKQSIEVKSAFGGFAFFKSDILNYCNWKTDTQCEHISFCEDVSKFGKIKLYPDIEVKVELDEEIIKKYR